MYQRSYALALQVYRSSLQFPDPARREIGRQLRTAAMSIPANVAEGWGRRSSAAEFRRFLTISQGSCDEVWVWLDFAKDLGHLDGAGYQELSQGYEEVGRMLHGLIQRWH